jgi:uncharacterized cupredoxin-like copper-binding protein
MKTLLTTAALAALVTAPTVYAAGDLSRNNPQEIIMEMGSSGSKMYFKPDHLDLETGKAYKLVLKNTDKIKHELEAPKLVEKIFTRKIEVADKNDNMIAEIKGKITEIEVGPGGTVEWFFVPVQTGKNMEMDCAIAGHKEAGMVGTVTIK